MARRVPRGSAAEARRQGRRDLDHRRWAEGARVAREVVSGLPPEQQAQVAGAITARLYQVLGRRRPKEAGEVPVVGMLEYLRILTGQTTPYWPDALPPRRMMGLMGHMAVLFGRPPRALEEWRRLRDAVVKETGRRFRLRDLRQQVEVCRGRMAEGFPEQGFVVDRTGAWLRT